jgi:hypothetical protein
VHCHAVLCCAVLCKLLLLSWLTVQLVTLLVLLQLLWAVVCCAVQVAAAFLADVPADVPVWGWKEPQAIYTLPFLIQVRHTAQACTRHVALSVCLQLALEQSTKSQASASSDTNRVGYWVLGSEGPG